MDESLVQFSRTLKQSGCSLTRPRQVIFSALQDSQPLTIQQLVKACSDIDRASVYRTVTIFEKLGVIQRLQIGWKYKLELSDAFQHHHHHLTCLKCGRVIPFDESQILETQLQAIAQVQKFKMQGHQLEIQGQCQNCSGT